MTQLERCGNCNLILTKKTELEYSRDLCEAYCSPSCATNRYHDYLRSVPISWEEFQAKIKERDKL